MVQTEINEERNVITFRTNATVMLQDYYSKQQKKESNAEEKIKLLQHLSRKTLEHPIKPTQRKLASSTYQILLEYCLKN